MLDLVGILTRTWIGLATPASSHLATHPIVAAPAAGSAATAATADASANDIVEHVQQFYGGIHQVTALFRQTVRDAAFGKTSSSDGKVWLMKPGKMRWDYYEKKGADVQVQKSFISNGTELHLVEHNNKQVITKNLSDDMLPVAVTFLYGKGQLKAEFDAAIDHTSSYGAKDDIVLKLTPKKRSTQYKNLFLVVSKDDYHVKESVIVDSSNNINHFLFYSPDFAKPIEASWFEFNPASVKNYNIINADKPAGDKGQGSAAPKKLNK